MASDKNAPRLDRQFLEKITTNLDYFNKLQDLALLEREYKPWRYVKYHSPQGIDAKDFWKMLLFVRKLRPIEHLDTGCDSPFVLAHPEALKKRLDNVYRILTFSIETDGHFKSLDETKRRMYLQRSLAEEAISSSQLEGAVTTRQVAREMLLTKRAPIDNSERMILNNYVTMSRLKEWRNKPLSLELIKDIQCQLTEGVLDDSKRGRFRREEDNVVVANNVTHEVVHQPPSCKRLEERLQKLVDFVNNDDDNGEFYYPFEKAAIIHFVIGYEHPFCDGNGRTARALFYWYLLRKGCWLIEFFSISSLLKRSDWRKQYNEAYVDVETNAFDLTYFVLFQMDCLYAAAKEFHEYVDTVQQEHKDLESLMKGILNGRQICLVKHARRHPNYVYTAAEHAAWHNIALNSARSDLEGLKIKGFLTLSKKGRTKIYTYRGNQG